MGRFVAVFGGFCALSYDSVDHFVGLSERNLLMEITEVRIKLVDSSSDKLRAFCSITIDDCFVIRDLKIIDGTKGAFVAMPSRKMTAKCRRCNCKNYMRAKFCNDCGGKLPVVRSEDDDGRGKSHADIAHPINSECRERLQSQVLDEYHAELDREGETTYEPDDIDDETTERSSGKEEPSASTETGKAEYEEDDEEEYEEGDEEEYEEDDEDEEDENYDDDGEEDDGEEAVEEDDEDEDDDEEEEDEDYEEEDEDDDEEEEDEEDDEEDEDEDEDEDEEESESSGDSDSNDDFGAGLLS